MNEVPCNLDSHMRCCSRGSTRMSTRGPTFEEASSNQMRIPQRDGACRYCRFLFLPAPSATPPPTLLAPFSHTPLTDGDTGRTAMWPYM